MIAREGIGINMSDGDSYEVCANCGTEFLQRSMTKVTSCGLYQCQRCWRRDNEPQDVHDYDEDYEDWGREP